MYASLELGMGLEGGRDPCCHPPPPGGVGRTGGNLDGHQLAEDVGYHQILRGRVIRRMPAREAEGATMHRRRAPQGGFSDAIVSGGTKCPPSRETTVRQRCDGGEGGDGERSLGVLGGASPGGGLRGRLVGGAACMLQRPSAAV